MNKHWLNANKICVNVGKIEVVLSNSLTKQTDSDLHIKLNGKRLYPTDSVKNLNWHFQISNAADKLNRANDMLPKTRHFFVNFNSLKSIYYAILESHLNYSLTVWSHKRNPYELCIF